ncbi:metal-sulfur cluster assembly factor [Caldalkalibacillus salinus]|uniref:metal-sulfur cluster assembly factor n=1 Tax=Caldalkalibacillus salinus TaxID=2803787 RepID=UPI001F3A84BC|nr:iron-sulfur cluster assembly protein [Caldalkalibacillus salinus]
MEELQELMEQIETNDNVTPELKEKVVEALTNVEDPELGIDIVNLGLVYRIEMDENKNVNVVMTLTSMGCPLAGMIVTLVKEALDKVEDVHDADVEIVWNPPWSKERVSRMAKMVLRIS